MRAHVAYDAAKHGKDNEAALALVYYCIRDAQVKKISERLKGRKPRIVAVHAEEAKGRNKIPMAYGEVLGGILCLDTDPGIVQASIANHSAAPSIYHRFASQPHFDGYVEPKAEYLIVDDTCTAGGTLANLKGFIEDNGGVVVAMSVLSIGNPNLAYDISLSAPTLRQLVMRHPSLDEWWKEEFGYGCESLTEGEAGHLRAAPSFDTIRNRIVEARRDLNVFANEVAHQRSSASPGLVNKTTSDSKTSS